MSSRPGEPRSRSPQGKVLGALKAPFSPGGLAVLLGALVALPWALAGMVAVLVGLLVGALLSWTTFGLWLLALTVRVALAVGDVQRMLTRNLLGRPVNPPAGRDTTARGAMKWRRALLTRRDGWRAVGYALLAPFPAVLASCAAVGCYVYGLLFLTHPVHRHWNYRTVEHPDGSVEQVTLAVGGVSLDNWPLWLLPVAVGAALLLLAPRVLEIACVPHQMLQRGLLGPSAEERRDQRIRTLEETRAHAVDDAVTTLRRIERDLHDGAQARLVGLGVQLSVLRELIRKDADRERLLAVVDTASGVAGDAVTDLRHLVRGIHPPVLDQGLKTALETLATDGPLPVDLTVELAARPTPAIESIAYFCATELLANAVKHSGATRVSIDASQDDDALSLTVWDNGRGGATVGAGSGLTGLLGRVRTVDGTLSCDSPPTGPTTVAIRLPFQTASIDGHSGGPVTAGGWFDTCPSG